MKTIIKLDNKMQRKAVQTAIEHRCYKNNLGCELCPLRILKCNKIEKSAVKLHKLRNIVEILY